MKLVEILTTLLLPLTFVSCSNFSSKSNPHEVAISNVPAQTGYRALPSSELLSLFRDAVFEDNPNQVHTLLENHVLPSQSPGEETLQQAVSHPYSGTNVPCPQDEFDINCIISDQGTLLHWAADRGYSDLVPVLLIRGANINSKCGQFTMTPLMYAASNGHGTAVAQLLNALAIHPELMHGLIMTKDDDDWTALHWSASKGHEDVVVQLLNALTVDPERMHNLITTQNNCGNTALHYAAQGGHGAVVVQLLNALTADPERMHSLITAQDNYGWTALHYAAKSGHEIVVVQLLDALATQPERIHGLITTQENSGWTAFYCACVSRKAETVKVLLERYKEALDKIASDASSSADELSSTCNDLVNLMNQEISWDLDPSVTHECVEIINLLVRSGANLDVRDVYGDTHLHRAARAGSSAVVIALVTNGAESRGNNAGKTPHDVAQGLTPEALSLLEECAARIILK